MLKASKCFCAKGVARITEMNYTEAPQLFLVHAMRTWIYKYGTTQGLCVKCEPQKYPESDGTADCIPCPTGKMHHECPPRF